MKMIPFDWEKYQKGYKAVLRDGSGVLKVYHIPEGHHEPYVSVDADGKTRTHFPSGGFYSSQESKLDLMLLAPEPKKVTKQVWVNVYKEGDMFLHNSKEEAVNMARLYRDRYVLVGAEAALTYELPEGE